MIERRKFVDIYSLLRFPCHKKSVKSRNIRTPQLNSQTLFFEPIFDRDYKFRIMTFNTCSQIKPHFYILFDFLPNVMERTTSMNSW